MTEGMKTNNKNQHDILMQQQRLQALCGNDDQKRQELFTGLKRSQIIDKILKPTRGTGDRQVAVAEQISINDDFTIKTGSFFGKKAITRPIFGHILHNWNAITSFEDGTKMHIEGQKRLVMQLIQEQGANPFITKTSSGKYVFEYAFESNLPIEIINTLILAPTKQTIDYAKLREHIEHSKFSSAEKTQILDNINLRQLHEAIKANNVKLVEDCLNRMQGNPLEILTIVNPHTHETALGMIEDDVVSPNIKAIVTQKFNNVTGIPLQKSLKEYQQEVDIFEARQQQFTQDIPDEIAEEELKNLYTELGINPDLTDKEDLSTEASFDEIEFDDDINLLSTEEELELQAEFDHLDAGNRSSKASKISDEEAEILLAELDKLEQEYDLGTAFNELEIEDHLAAADQALEKTDKISDILANGPKARENSISSRQGFSSWLEQIESQQDQTKGQSWEK